jgi:hypothetical protein
MDLISVADPDPGSGAFLTPASGIFLTLDPGSGMEKFGSGTNIPDPQHWISFWITQIKKLRIRII